MVGFSVLELMIVVAIFAVIAGIGTPSFIQMMNNFRVSTTMGQLLSDLAQARNEAIKRNARVLVCVRNNAGTDCGAVTDWQNGWLVCVDDGTGTACAPGNNVIDGSPNLISARSTINNRLRLNGSGATIVFNASGTQGAGGVATLTLNGTWAGAVANIASISATGKISRQ